MKRRIAIAAVLVVLVAAGAVFAEVCLSPYVKRLAGPEKFLYISAVDADGRDNDFLAVVDVSLPSPTYGRVVNTLSLGSAGNEPHHMGWSDDRTKIWVGTLLSKKLFIVDVAADPSRPTIVKTIEDISAVTGLHGPHTYYALPGRMLLTFLSSADGNPPGGMAEFTNDGELVRVIKNPADSPYAYDVAVKPDVNRMITSSFTPLRNYRKPLPQWDMKDGGNTLLVWDFKERKVIQTLTTDPVPLEVRWSVRPGKAHGWTNSALGDSIWFFAQGKDGKFATKKVADLGKGCLPADLRQSLSLRLLLHEERDPGVGRVDARPPATPRHGGGRRVAEHDARHRRRQAHVRHQLTAVDHGLLGEVLGPSRAHRPRRPAQGRSVLRRGLHEISERRRARSRHAAELRWAVASSGLWPRRCSSAQLPPPGGTSRRRLRRRAGD